MCLLIVAEIRFEMAPERAALEAVVDTGSAHGEAEQDATQSKKDREIERLKLEIQRLREEVAREKSQTSSTFFPMPLAAVPRREVGRMSDREEVSLKDFLSYGTLEFRGEIGIQKSSLRRQRK